jgi:hypothetical protein
MKGTKDVMDYIPVQTPQNHDVGLLMKDGQEVDPLSLIIHQKKEELPDAVSYIVVELLKENYTIQKTEICIFFPEIMHIRCTKMKCR